MSNFRLNEIELYYDENEWNFKVNGAEINGVKNLKIDLDSESVSTVNLEFYVDKVTVRNSEKVSNEKGKPRIEPMKPRIYR
jgi:hypothetical protein